MHTKQQLKFGWMPAPIRSFKSVQEREQYLIFSSYCFYWIFFMNNFDIIMIMNMGICMIIFYHFDKVNEYLRTVVKSNSNLFKNINIWLRDHISSQWTRRKNKYKKRRILLSIIYISLRAYISTPSRRTMKPSTVIFAYWATPPATSMCWLNIGITHYSTVKMIYSGMRKSKARWQRVKSAKRVLKKKRNTFI